jgi:ABC-type bacteriocin/lantibiotic exporter with double-glycine peptidase domain
MRRTSGWVRGKTVLSLIIPQTYPLQAGVIAFGLALPALAVVLLSLQQQLIDEAIPVGNAAALLAIAAMYGGVALLAGALKFTVTFFRGWIQEIVCRVLRVAVVEAQRHRTAASASRNLGRVTSAITKEVEDIGAFVSEALNTPLIEGGTLLGLMGFLIYSEPQLAAIGIAALVVQGVLTPLMQARINVLTRKRIVTMRRAGLDMIDAASPRHNAMIVPALREIRRGYRLQLRMNMMKAALKVFSNLVMHAATIAVFCFGGLLAIRGEISVGLIFAFLSGLRQIDDQWGVLLDFYRRYTDAVVKYRLIVIVLESDGVEVAQAAPRRGAGRP